MDIKGGSALIVGGAGGFGAATTRRLAAVGAHVVIADLAEERGTALAAELGGSAQFVKTDILDEASVSAALAVASSKGPLRAVVIVNGGPAAGARIVGRDGKRYPFERSNARSTSSSTAPSTC